MVISNLHLIEYPNLFFFIIFFTFSEYLVNFVLITLCNCLDETMKNLLSFRNQQNMWINIKIKKIVVSETRTHCNRCNKS